MLIPGITTRSTKCFYKCCRIKWSIAHWWRVNYFILNDIKVETEDISSIAGLVLFDWSRHRISSSDADIKNYFVFLYSVSFCHATIGCVTSDRGYDIRDIGRQILFSQNPQKVDSYISYVIGEIYCWNIPSPFFVDL